MLMLWRAYDTGAGSGHLPDPGGMMDQPAVMMAAFAWMSRVAAHIEARGISASMEW